MAEILDLREGFETGPSGAVITTTNTIADSITGTATGQPTFFTDSYGGTLCGRFVTAATTRILRFDFVARPLVWFKFALRVETAPATATGIVAWYSVASKVGDLRLMPGGLVSLRDGNTGVWTSTALAAGWHEVAVLCQPGSATGHRVRIYSGANRGTPTPTQDSGTQPATVTTALDNLRLGVLSAETSDIRFDRLFGDDSAEPDGGSPPGGSISVSAAVSPSGQVNAYTACTVSASVTGGTAPSTFTFTQTAGPAVTLSGTGSSRTFTAPALLDGATLSWDVTATDSTGATDTATATTTVLPHNYWFRSGSSWLPLRRSVRVGSSWTTV